MLVSQSRDPHVLDLVGSSFQSSVSAVWDKDSQGLRGAGFSCLYILSSLINCPTHPLIPSERLDVVPDDLGRHVPCAP